VDGHNLFETPTTYRALRAEYLVGLIVAAYLMIDHIGDIRIIPAILLFAYNDAIGYIPGAIAYRRAPDGRISNNYYVAYNIGHSIITAAVVAGLWALLVKPEWAELIIVVHICGDRAIFGNFMKQFSVHFEPKEHPAYTQAKDLFSRPAWDLEASGLPPQTVGEHPSTRPVAAASSSTA
jgi:hypothetical protein